MLQSKQCPKCNTRTTYQNIIELYEIKDFCAIWTCSQCGHEEIMSNDELIFRCRIKNQYSNLTASS